MSITTRFQHAWNAFMNKDPTFNLSRYAEGSYSYRPDRPRLHRGNERSIVTSVINRMSLDASAIDIKHVKLDLNGRYESEVNSDLNDCLSLSANIDQTGRALRQDIVISMLDEGCVAVVPVITEGDPTLSDSYKIYSLRTGKIVQWYPEHVTVHLYNDMTGRYEDLKLPKTMVAIIENPFYSVMNESNSTMQRLIRKLNLLDVIDEQSGSGKLDLIIQVPYSARTPGRKAQAEERIKDLTDQLSGSRYGIAYTDGTEKIVQLNRAVDNNLMAQIEYLQAMLYSQLGVTKEILEGSADDNTMNNYYNRTIEPILSAITDEMKRKFLTKTARTQKQSINFFRDPFKLVPTTQIAEIADKFTRNEIMTSNEIRQVIGMIPSKDPSADQLRNKNLSESKEAVAEKEQVDVYGNKLGNNTSSSTEPEETK